MKAIWAISMLTLKEALRNRILYLLFAFAFVMISLSWIIGQLTVGDEMKIIKDLGLASIHFFGVLITIFIGIGLVFREMEKRTIYLILSKPLQRYQFLAGKILGLAVTLFLVLVGLVFIFYIVLIAKKDPSPELLSAFYLIYLEWLLIAAIALVFSSFSTPLLSGMLTIACFFAGHLSSSLLALRDRVDSAVADTVFLILYYLLPNLEIFNIRAQIVHEIPVAAGYYLDVTLYWALYLGALYLFAVSVFQKKDFV